MVDTFYPGQKDYIAKLNTLALAGDITAGVTAANAARDQALEAWNASMAPAETLPAMSKVLHSGVVVKTFLYDTSKDSDGGAWRQRCAHTSWENEALCSGKWIGQKATTATAWATVGAVAGDFFQNTTDGKFYTLTGTTTAAEVFRGNGRKFPAVVNIVAESSRVVIYDAATGAMWLVLICTATSSWWGTGGLVSSVSVLNGVLASGALGGHLHLVSFIADEYGTHATAGLGYLGRISGRNAIGPYATFSGQGIVNSIVNDIAITILDGAPIDPCFVGETLVIMADGSLVRIDQVEVGSSVKTLEGHSEVVRWIDQGVKDVITLVFAEGAAITCTPNHKIRTTAGWVEAQHLTPEHDVVGL